MKDSEKTLIMKFGGASASTPAAFTHLAGLIEEKRRQFSKIVVVISAMQGMTDSLIALAKEVHPEPPRREYDMLVSSGERISIALLAMALSYKGIDAVSFTGSQSGIITSNDHSEAKIIDMKPERIVASLNEGFVAIVAGFQGVSRNKEITTLGRGGSDTTAVALGIALNAEKVEFYKDVKGIFENDPKIDSKATQYSHLTYEKALHVIAKTGGKILHPRAVQLASKNDLPLYVRSFLKEDVGTLIGGINKKENAIAAYE